MPERRPQGTPGNILSEILGFDPESGERVEVRSGLMEFKATKFAKIKVPALAFNT